MGLLKDIWDLITQFVKLHLVLNLVYYPTTTSSGF